MNIIMVEQYMMEMHITVHSLITMQVMVEQCMMEALATVYSKKITSIMVVEQYMM